MITLTVVALRGPLKKKWHSGELQEKKAFRLVGGDLTYSFPTETGDSKHESSGIYVFDLLVLIVFFLHYEGEGGILPLCMEVHKTAALKPSQSPVLKIVLQSALKCLLKQMHFLQPLLYQLNNRIPTGKLLT